MTFADSVMRLVRSGTRTDSASASDAIAPEDSDDAVDGARAVAPPATIELADGTLPQSYLTAEAAQDILPFEPGLPHLEAAVELVSTGLAVRVVLSGFPSWPGLLWHAYHMAETSGVRIIPTVVRPGGKVDIVITRDIAPIG